MNRLLMAAGAIACFLGVAFGAFGAHALSHLLQGKAAGWYQTAVQYQFIHGLALLFCSTVGSRFGHAVTIAGVFFITGLLVFCGTLFAMALGAPTWLGMITPVGGVFLLAAWAVLIWCILRSTHIE